MASVDHVDDRTEIRFAGRIDHHSVDEFATAFAELRPTVRLNFAEVKRIDSYGVGLLMRHLGAIATSHRVELAECSEIMVDQFQMLSFSRYARIISFFAHYACPRCDRLESRLLDVQRDLRIDVAQRQVDAPTFPCACGGTLVVDDPLEFVLTHV